MAAAARCNLPCLLSQFSAPCISKAARNIRPSGCQGSMYRAELRQLGAIELAGQCRCQHQGHGSAAKVKQVSTAAEQPCCMWTKQAIKRPALSGRHATSRTQSRIFPCPCNLQFKSHSSLIQVVRPANAGRLMVCVCMHASMALTQSCTSQMPQLLPTASRGDARSNERVSEFKPPQHLGSALAWYI